jgi:hypothetical protein
LDCIDTGLENVTYGGGYDADATAGFNVLDQEVAYYLQMKFCPWDLFDAANKDSQRHVIVDESFSGTSIDLVLDGVDVVPAHLVGANDLDASGVVGDTTAEAEAWKAYGTFAERVVYDDDTGPVLLKRGVDYTIDISSTPAAIDFTNSLVGRLEIYFSVNNTGSYEWTAVGRDSAVVDSAAASMVTAGFNAINSINTLWAALDMKDTTHLTPQYLHQKYGAGDARTDYHYDHAGDDHRSALKKYWSTTIPIASSNIISVGGPGANLVSEYFNEFMPVIYRGQFFGVADLLIAPSWDSSGAVGDKPARISNQITSDVTNNLAQTRYNITDNIDPQIIPTDEQDYGWAVVATYMDINGTVGFNIWGATGNDSFWAAQAFQNGLNFTTTYKQTPITIYKEFMNDTNTNGPSTDDPLVKDTLVDLGGDENSIAEWLFDEEVAGVTVLVLWIDYSDTSVDGGYHPEITIVEQVGIISETPQHDP